MFRLPKRNTKLMTFQIIVVPDEIDCTRSPKMHQLPRMVGEIC